MKFETVEQHNKEINKRGFVGYEGKLVITFRDRKKSHLQYIMENMESFHKIHISQLQHKSLIEIELITTPVDKLNKVY